MTDPHRTTPQPRKRPPAWSATGRVWAIADEMMAATGAIPSGRAVVDRYLAEEAGRNEGTAFTQFSHWKKAVTAPHQRRPRGPAPRPELRLMPDGSVILPAGIIASLGLAPGADLAARVEGGVLRLEPAAPATAPALARARAIVRAFDAGRGSPVDELLAERRAEAQG